MVTVIDAASFSENFASVEFADVVLLNKADLAGDDRVAFAEKTVQRLNPHATTLATTQSNAPVADMLLTGKFDFRRTACAAGWAGAVGRLCSDGMWYVSAPPEFWRQAEAAGITDDIMKDFPEEEQMEDPEELNLADSVGDRRQEIRIDAVDAAAKKFDSIPMDDKDPAAVAELRAKFCEDAAELLGPDPLSKDDPVKPWE
ncbi:ATP binding protein [Aureococcus anophagefferens]|nr:ATP binding protein [Aureococcus anophagefferens]